MNRRRSRLVIAALAMICLGMLASVVYPVSPSTPQASLGADEGFSVGDHEAFSVDAQLTVDGDPALELDGTVTADGARYRRVDDNWSTAEAYQASPNATVYERYTIHEESAVDSHREAISSADDRTILRETTTEDETVLVVRVTEGFAFAEELSGSASLFVTSMGLTRYERVGGTNGTHVYAPQNGWFTQSRAYRITNASGEVRVDSQTGVVEAGSVAWDITDPANNYARERVARLFGAQPDRYAVDYAVETEVSNVSRPTWVPNQQPATATP